MQVLGQELSQIMLLEDIRFKPQVFCHICSVKDALLIIIFLPAKRMETFVATDHDKFILKQISAEWGVEIDERILKHGFSWPTGDFQAYLEHTPTGRHVRERNLTLAQSALLTIAHAQKLYGNEIILPNNYNEPEVAHVHQWIALGNGIDLDRFSSPEEIQSMALEFVRGAGPESVDRPARSCSRCKDDSSCMEQSSAPELSGQHRSGRSLNAAAGMANHKDSYGSQDSEEGERDPAGPGDGIQESEEDEEDPDGPGDCSNDSYSSDDD
jgi:hypothetical protein